MGVSVQALFMHHMLKNRAFNPQGPGVPYISFLGDPDPQDWYYWKIGISTAGFRFRKDLARQNTRIRNQA